MSKQGVDVKQTIMADDIIDSMFKSLINLAGWIFKKIFQLAWWLISSIFKLFWKLITGNKGGSDRSQIPGVDNNAVMQLYTDTEVFVQNLDINNSSNESELIEKTNVIITMFANNIMTNGIFTVNQKCQLLSLLNNKLAQETTPEYYNLLFMKIIEYSYKVLEGVIPSPMLLRKYDLFKQQLAQDNVTDFNAYFGEIFSASGLLGSPDGKFNMDYGILEKYDLPKHREAA